MVRRKIPNPCVMPVNMRITESMKAAVDSAADALGVSTNEFIRVAIQEKLDRASAPASASSLSAVDREAIRSFIREELEKMEKKEAGDGSL